MSVSVHACIECPKGCLSNNQERFIKACIAAHSSLHDAMDAKCAGPHAAQQGERPAEPPAQKDADGRSRAAVRAPEAAEQPAASAGGAPHRRDRGAEAAAGACMPADRAPSAAPTPCSHAPLWLWPDGAADDGACSQGLHPCCYTAKLRPCGLIFACCL